MSIRIFMLIFLSFVNDAFAYPVYTVTREEFEYAKSQWEANCGPPQCSCPELRDDQNGQESYLIRRICIDITVVDYRQMAMRKRQGYVNVCADTYTCPHIVGDHWYQWYCGSDKFPTESVEYYIMCGSGQRVVNHVQYYDETWAIRCDEIITGTYDVNECPETEEILARYNLIENECKTGEFRTCPYTGPSGTENVGSCKAGSILCERGKWNSSCQGEVLPQRELCNGKDDNCNNKTDEGCDFDFCPNSQ